ncbi:MAG: hypothetical protein K9J06_14255 [Flavobacteriales bacterium]|nr:hypothetical protein [Flavobacteriales bacterium]
MFKRLFLISGILAMGLTALVYYTLMVSKVDVSSAMEVQSVVLPGKIGAVEGDVVVIQGFIDRTGTTILGKREVLLTDGTGTVAVFCTFVIGEPQAAVKAGDTVTVKGVWYPIVQNNPGVPVVVGRITDCISQ